MKTILKSALSVIFPVMMAFSILPDAIGHCESLASDFGICNVKVDPPTPAVGNGSTDDTAAIQYCITYYPVIFFPAGTYLVGYTGSLPFSITGAQTLYGVGRSTAGGSIISVYLGSSANVFTVNTPQAAVFRDLQITTSNSSTRSTGCGIDLEGYTTNSIIENCSIAYQQYNIKMGYSSQSHIKGNYLVSAYTAEIYASDSSCADCGGGEIIGNVMAGSAPYGMLQENGGGVKFIGNQEMSHQYGYVYNCDSNSGGDTSDVIIQGNSFNTASVIPILFEQTSGSYNLSIVTIDGNVIYSQGSAGISFTGGTGWLNYVTVSNNNILVNAKGSVGINLADGNYVTVTGNNIRNQGSASNAVAVAASYPQSARIEANNAVNFTSPWTLAGNTSVTWVQGPITKAYLTAAAPGSSMYCSDCKVQSSCVTGGSGAIAKYLNNAWVCN